MPGPPRRPVDGPVAPDYRGRMTVIDRVLEVYRDPSRSPAAPYGWKYRTVTVLGPPAMATPLAAPTGIPVADLLP